MIIQMLTRPQQYTTRRSMRAPMMTGHHRPFLLFPPRTPSLSLEAVKNLLSKWTYLCHQRDPLPTFVASRPPHLAPGHPIGMGSDNVGLYEVFLDGQPPEDHLSPEKALVADITKFVREDLERSVGRIVLLRFRPPFYSFHYLDKASSRCQGRRRGTLQGSGRLPGRSTEGSRPHP